MIISLDNWVDADRRQYRVKRRTSMTGRMGITDALSGKTGIVSSATEENRVDIFYMLMFCLCVAQSKAIKAGEAVDILRKRNFYKKEITVPDLIDVLKGRVRFHKTKARRLYLAKAAFYGEFWYYLRDRAVEFKTNDSLDFLKETRRVVCKQINGLGMKGASHFLRNIGFRGLSILDVHVLNQMQRRGLISETKKALTISEYCDIEAIEREYAGQVGIELDELDLLWWSDKTGYVYK